MADTITDADRDLHDALRDVALAVKASRPQPFNPTEEQLRDARDPDPVDDERSFTVLASSPRGSARLILPHGFDGAPMHGSTPGRDPSPAP